ncbi:MAG: DNA repair protein RecO [Flavobacteriales bacterium]|nr:DNA repair protein RecO [Flavobacteriales bacterium]MCB9449657.1 DNA repair protein RecO [Flavobacteriales bacterium]
MFRTCEAIVLNSIRFQENKLITRVLTEDLGMRSVISSRGNAKSNRNKGLLQPLSILEISFSLREKSQLHHIREVQNAHPLLTLQQDPIKISLALFTAELLHKALREEATSPQLFRFVRQTIIDLDDAPGVSSSFIIGFPLGLMRHLGIQPHNNRTEDAPYFHLEEGEFFRHPASSPDAPTREESLVLSEMLEALPGDVVFNTIGRPMRKRLTAILLSYLRFHRPGFGELRSYQVLEQVFH